MAAPTQIRGLTMQTLIDIILEAFAMIGIVTVSALVAVALGG